MSSDYKAKWCGAGLETKDVSCGVSAPSVVSGLAMCITKVNIPQNESEAQSLKVHKLF